MCLGREAKFAQLFKSGDTAQQCPLVIQLSYIFPKITLLKAPVGLPNNVTITPTPQPNTTLEHFYTKYCIWYGRRMRFQWTTSKHPLHVLLEKQRNTLTLHRIKNSTVEGGMLSGYEAYFLL